MDFDIVGQLSEIRSHGFTRTGFFDLAVIFLNTATIVMLVPKLFRPDQLFSLNQTYRAGLGIIVIGLAAQIPISICRLLNYRLPDIFAGMWSMKDIGVFLFVFSTTFLGAANEYKKWRQRDKNED